MKNSVRIVIGFLFLVLVQGNLIAQELSSPCGTMEQDSIVRARFPKRGSLQDFENAVQNKIQQLKNQRTLAGVVTIPVIVHVVHNGEAVGTGTNISQAQVQAQLEVLNEDFRKMVGTPGYNTNPVGADIEIEFCLSPVDANGNAMAEPGIHRHNGGKASWTVAQIDGTLKPQTIWNPNLFFNIWTVKFGGENANLLGYAQFPDSDLPGLEGFGTAANTDGVVVQFSSFGSVAKGSFPVMQAPYNRGRTLTHETGHWLGLRHIWGDGACGDDYVADTPTQQNESRGCPTSKLACNSSTIPAMVQNYMDYSDDACMNIFTQGQKTRIQAVMAMSPRRKTLIEGNLCSPTVADIPTPNFTSDKDVVLLGGEVNFTDLSTNFPTAWNWTFEGGDPGISTERAPRVKYTVPGVYSVTLIATNSLGSSDPLTLEGYITVSEDGLCGVMSNFSDSYTPSAIPLADFGAYTGYLTGHNSTNSKAVSEYFKNVSGYEYISGVKIKFASVNVVSEEATVMVKIWNDRGPQSAPGALIEQKVLLLKQIQDDIDNDRETIIVLDRETPVLGRPFHVGIELNYDDQGTIVVESSGNGEATTATAWVQNEASVWSPYTLAWGANIAMNIEPLIGMNLSVQVSASKQLINPGEEVTLSGRGASVFIWNAEDGSVEDFAGPQLTVRPTTTTTYLTIGSGLDLCYDSAYTTIYTRDDVLSTEEESLLAGVSIYPNPGTSGITVHLDNAYIGNVQFQVQSVLGQTEKPFMKQKETRTLTLPIETSKLQSGVYLIKISMGNRTLVKKWIKR